MLALAAYHFLSGQQHAQACRGQRVQRGQIRRQLRRGGNVLLQLRFRSGDGGSTQAAARCDSQLIAHDVFSIVIVILLAKFI